MSFKHELKPAGVPVAKLKDATRYLHYKLDHNVKKLLRICETSALQKGTTSFLLTLKYKNIFLVGQNLRKINQILLGCGKQFDRL